MAWVDRYRERASDCRLPNSETERQAYAELIGADGLTLLTALWDSHTPIDLRQLNAVQTLWLVGLQTSTWNDEGGLRWRTAKELPPASVTIYSPYDLDVHFGQKRVARWLGYKVHVTESCADDTPNLIPQVETTLAPVQDVTMPPRSMMRSKQKTVCLPPIG